MSGAKIVEGMQEAVAFARGDETGAVLHDVGSLEWWRKRAQWLSERVDALNMENTRLGEALAPFADFVLTIEQRANDALPVAVGGFASHRKTLTVGDIRRAKAALPHPTASEER